MRNIINEQRRNALQHGTAGLAIVERCDHVKDILDWYDINNHDELVSRLSKYEETYITERTQTALEYPQTEATDFAYVEIMNIIQGRAMSMDDIMEEYYE